MEHKTVLKKFDKIAKKIFEKKSKNLFGTFQFIVIDRFAVSLMRALSEFLFSAFQVYNC